MDRRILLVLACTMFAASAWSVQRYPPRRVPMRFTRFAPPPSHIQEPPHRTTPSESDEQWQRPKRGHDDFDYDHDRRHDHHDRGTGGVTGPVHTFVKTDKNANYKWGVRHHVGDKYAS